MGQQFPKFELQDQDGSIVNNSIFQGRKTLVYFYPKDDTSGCTAQACGLQETLPDFGDANVIGVSPDSVKSHRKFADKYGLKFTLLADEGHALAEANGLWVEKSLYGKKYMGVERTSFLVDENGAIERVWRKVKPQGHAQEVLDYLKNA